MKLISVVTGCFNEEDNVDELHARIRAQFECLPAYDYEHIFIDNASTDATVARIKALAARDQRVKLIVNTRNFGHIRSPIHACCRRAATRSSPWPRTCRNRRN
jgi:glycosyltransferase involved in cell wall biosynthesis